MEDFSMNDMLEMQRALQEKYKNKWEVISLRLVNTNYYG